jgi:hypothetical protein
VFIYILKNGDVEIETQRSVKVQLLEGILTHPCSLLIKENRGLNKKKTEV